MGFNSAFKGLILGRNIPFVN